MPSPPRRDYLPECNDLRVPLADFQAQFCERCVQPECSRSQYGKSRFDQRVSTWTERLFEKVPRMDPHDPRYLPIHNAPFKMIDGARAPSVRSNWVDPREIADPKPAPKVALPAVSSPKVVPPVTFEAPASSEVPAEAPQAPAEAPPSVTRGPRPAPSPLALGNTPPPPKMLPGAEKAAEKPDAWASPTQTPSPALPGERVIKRGARVKLGGSGVE
jgi:hypothetical protein